MDGNKKLMHKKNNNIDQGQNMGIWSSGMILTLGTRGPEFNSRNAPTVKFNILFCRLKNYSATTFKQQKYKVL